MSDLKGNYQYTAKLRAKGLLVVVFFSPDSAPSGAGAPGPCSPGRRTYRRRSGRLWAWRDGDRAEMGQFAEAHGLKDISIVLDHELYQTRQWGVSHLPSLYLVSGKTGRVLHKILGEDGKALDGMQADADGGSKEDRVGGSRREAGGGRQEGGRSRRQSRRGGQALGQHPRARQNLMGRKAYWKEERLKRGLGFPALFVIQVMWLR